MKSRIRAPSLYWAQTSAYNFRNRFGRRIRLFGDGLDDVFEGGRGHETLRVKG